MSGSTKPAAISRNLEDASCPGVMIEFDPDTAEKIGAFREDAISETDAWHSNREGGEGQGEKPK